MEIKLQQLLATTQESLKFYDYKTISVPLSTIYCNATRENLRDLTHSIALYGILSPMIVTNKAFDNADQHKCDSSIYKYQIIVGHKRFLAAKKLNMLVVPVIFIDKAFDIREKEFYLTENLNSKRFSLINEAKCYNSLLEEGVSLLDISKIINKSTSYIKNILKLLSLPTKAKNAVKKIHPSVILKIIGNDQYKENFLEKIINDIYNAIESVISCKAKDSIAINDINLKEKTNELEFDVIENRLEVEEFSNCQKDDFLKKEKVNYQQDLNLREDEEIIELEAIISKNINEQVKISKNNDSTYNLSINNLTLEKLDHLIANFRKEVLKI